MIRSLDHVNVRVRDLRATLDFYEKVLGMRPAVPPGMSDMTTNAWICDAEGRAVLHVGTAKISSVTGGGAGEQVGQGSGAVDHVAFNCVDYAQVLDRIRSNGVTPRCHDIPAAGLRQIFIHDPDRILLELNFRE